jgi:7-cyano-7-deazaguanine synthase
MTTLLLSGGLDSVVLLYHLIENHKVHCVLIDYAQRHVQELNWAMHHAVRTKSEFTVLRLPQLKGSELTDGKGSVIVPNRNAIMLSLAVNVAESIGSGVVAFAANKDDEEVFPDCRIAFVNALNELLEKTRLIARVEAPFLNVSKSWIVARGRDLGVNFNETWSCYRGGLQPCGECAACLKREQAM